MKFQQVALLASAALADTAADQALVDAQIAIMNLIPSCEKNEDCGSQDLADELKGQCVKKITLTYNSASGSIEKKCATVAECKMGTIEQSAGGESMSLAYDCTGAMRAVQYVASIMAVAVAASQI